MLTRISSTGALHAANGVECDQQDRLARVPLMVYHRHERKLCHVAVCAKQQRFDSILKKQGYIPERIYE